MKSLLMAVALLPVAFVPAPSIAAEADSTAAPSRPNSLQTGAWAIQFVTHGNYDGGGIFVKKHLKANHAVRLGAELNLDTQSGDYNRDTTSVALFYGTVEQDQFEIQVDLVVQRYTSLTGSAHAFYGIGPFFEYSEFHDEQNITERTTGRDESRSFDRERYEVGGEVVLGAEWFASRALSIGIEYPFLFGYSSTTEERLYDYYGSSPSEREVIERDGWFFDAGDHARLMLGIYF